MEEIKSWSRVLKYAAQDATGSKARERPLRRSRIETSSPHHGSESSTAPRRPWRNCFRLPLNVRLNIGWNRLFPYFGYHHMLMLILALVTVLTSLMLGGCTSVTGMVNIYLLQLKYQQGSCPSDGATVNPSLPSNISSLDVSASAVVRVGYFGFCIKRTPDMAWQCSSDLVGIARDTQPAQDPLNLIQLASTLQARIVFPWLVIVAVAFMLLAFFLLSTFPGWRVESDPRTGSDVDVKPFPSRPVSQIALFATSAAALLMLVSVLWQHVGSVAASEILRDYDCLSVHTNVGTAAMTLGWAAVGLAVTVMLGLLVMILSISVLDRPTQDDD